MSQEFSNLAIFLTYLIAHLSHNIGSNVGHLGSHVSVLGGERLPHGEAGSARPAAVLLITSALLVLPEQTNTGDVH